MDLRNLPSDTSPNERVHERRSRIESELGVDLSHLAMRAEQIGKADERNCEQMFGAVPIPVGLAGPLGVHFSSGETKDVYLPLATTEGALVASVNRGCKALRESGGVQTSSEYVGITRSIALQGTIAGAAKKIRETEQVWKSLGEKTSSHLKILSYEIEEAEDIVFLTLAGDTDEAMGMNMLTIAAQEIGTYLARELGMSLLTVASNVDGDKKPNARTKKKGRGFRASASATISSDVVGDVLKCDVDVLLATARAKLELGSALAGALSSNLHVANTLSALYIATGQDAAHVVEGSLADTKIERAGSGISISVSLPAIIVGVRGGGIELPAQNKCLELLMREKTSLRPSAQLAQTIAAAALAGEISLLAAQATNTLAGAHCKLAR